MPGLRTLGVWGANNPTKKSMTVQAAPFAIGGIICQLERRFDVALQVTSMNDVAQIFGQQVYSGAYGPDAVDGFFKNLNGQPGTLYVYSAPNCGAGSPGAIGDTQPSIALGDLAAAGQHPLTVMAAWQGNLEWGTPANRTGVVIESWAPGSAGVPVPGAPTFPTGYRGFTQAAAVSGTSGNTIQVNSVLDLVVGDQIYIYGSVGSTPQYIYTKVTGINAATKTITVQDSFTAAKASAVGDYIFVPGFRVHTWRANLAGVAVEVDNSLGQLWLSLNSADSSHYASAVFNAQSNYLNLTVNTTSTLYSTGQNLPAVQTSPVYPTSTVTGSTCTPATDGATEGTNGGTSMTGTMYYRAMHAFDALPVRFIAIAETTDTPTQQSLQTYCQTRGLGDNPIGIIPLPSGQTKQQLITQGNVWQAGGEVDAVLIGHWGQRQDPFSVSSLALPRNIPLVGHVMGLWCQAIGAKGVHFIPCTKDLSIQGLVGLVGPQFPLPQDRTDIANAGVNCVEFLSGYNYILRNLFTPATTVDFQFANALLMRNFVKVSCVNSLQTSENTPNSLNRIADDRQACLNFLYQLWNVGSTGNVPLGETFGQIFNSDGSVTTPTQHFEVRADSVNNPQQSLNAGNRNIDIYFTFPAPAGSIKIGVGLILRN